MLGFIPTNRVVTVYQVGKSDDFGIPVKDTEGTEYDCTFSFNTEYKKINIADGSEIVFTASMIFPDPQKVAIKVADKVEFTDDAGKMQKKSVKLVQYKRDFAGQVLSVKAVI